MKFRGLCTTAAVFSKPSVSPSELKNQVLKASLKHVNRKGWSKLALASGAQDLSLPPVAHGMFPRGAAEIAEYWIRRGNENLKQHMLNLTKEASTTTETSEDDQLKELVIKGLQYRLEHTVPFLRSWPQAMALGLYPENVSTTLQLLGEIPDIICFHAGDKGYENRWFERRNAVGAIYAAAELYMLTDYSEGYQDTKDFVRRRVDDSLHFENMLNTGVSAQPFQGSRKVASAAVTGVESIVSAGLSMIFPIATQVLKNVPKPPGSEAVQDSFKDAAAGIHDAAEKFADATGSSELKNVLSNAKRTIEGDVQASEPQPKQEEHQSDTTVTTVNLPDGFSLFGLCSMKAEEAAKMVEENNEGFKVIVWPADETFEPVNQDKIVRLLVNSDQIVVDVWRH